VTIFDSGSDAGGDGAAGFVGDKNDMLVRTDAQAGFHSVLCAGH
jgi:hypothetical protein